MELIDNLDTLEVGDYVKVIPRQSFRREVIIGIVIKTNKEQLFIGIEYKLDNQKPQVFYRGHDEKPLQIPKTPRKMKKKLRHKTQSHNDGTIIYKLSKNEIRKIKNEELLQELEY